MGVDFCAWHRMGHGVLQQCCWEHVHKVDRRIIAIDWIRLELP